MTFVNFLMTYVSKNYWKSKGLNNGIIEWYLIMVLTNAILFSNLQNMPNPILTIPMDAAGRVVIPQELRKRFGLSGKALFKVIQTKEAILLEPIEEAPK